jgi:hypothetical protein
VVYWISEHTLSIKEVSADQQCTGIDDVAFFERLFIHAPSRGLHEYCGIYAGEGTPQEEHMRLRHTPGVCQQEDQCGNQTMGGNLHNFQHWNLGRLVVLQG